MYENHIIPILYFLPFYQFLLLLLILKTKLQKEIKIKLENEKILAEKLGNLKLDEIPQPVQNTIPTQEYGKPTSQLVTESTSAVLSIRRSARLSQQKNQ